MGYPDEARGSRIPLGAPRFILIISALALMLIGLLMVYSTSSVIELANAKSLEDAAPMKAVISQGLFGLIGIVAAGVLWKLIPSSVWRGNLVWAVWGVAVALLVLTALFGVGEDDWGAKRWLRIGPFSLQASEFAKIALVLVATRLFTDMREGAYAVGTFFALAFVLVLVPILLILGLQSDLGTAMICVAGVFAVMWLGEVPSKTLAVVAAVVVAAGIFAIVIEPYRFQRFTVFLNPWNDGENGLGNGYQIIHSLYALAGGGLFGVGLGNSHEKFLYLTQSDSDFIFAIIGEELGFAGALAVIVLFLLFLFAGMRIARAASSESDAMMAGALTVMISFQAFLNIIMVVGWFPVVGKPLPFVSSGGSSLVATLIMVGLILSVSHAESSPRVYERRRADLRIVRAEGASPKRGSAMRAAPFRDARARAGLMGASGGAKTRAARVRLPGFPVRAMRRARLE